MANSRLIRRFPLLVLLLALPAYAQNLLIKPYVQHGDDPALGKTDSKVIAFATDNVPGDFAVEFTTANNPWQRVTPKATLIEAGSTKGVKAPPPPTPRAGTPEDSPPEIDPNPHVKMLAYRADLAGLPLSSVVKYRLLKSNVEVLAAEFVTRKPPTDPIDFVVFGDSAHGYPEQRRVAYQISLQKPELLLHVGDNVYTEGRISQYARNFWPDYCNVDDPSAKNGAPLLRYAPFYMALGNHDIDGADLKNTPDGLASFLFFHFPLNGPDGLKSRPALDGPRDRLAWFAAGAGKRFPRMSNYSFDNGPVHFLVLDANRYADVTEKAWRDWVAADLAATKLPWKVVAFHQPPFAISLKHMDEQRMRAFVPLFEAGGVNVVFSGHVHNYQRSRPLRFVPTPDAKGRIKPLLSGVIPGRATLDETFDGKTNTVPNGIIYIVTGAGGGGLHDDHFTDVPELWPRLLANYISNRYSFTRVKAEPEKLTIRQLGEDGTKLDEIVITRKP